MDGGAAYEMGMRGGGVEACSPVRNESAAFDSEQTPGMFGECQTLNREILERDKVKS